MISDENSFTFLKWVFAALAATSVMLVFVLCGLNDSEQIGNGSYKREERQIYLRLDASDFPDLEVALKEKYPKIWKEIIPQVTKDDLP